MDAKRVLVFPAGTEIAFEIQNALKYSKFVELFGGTSVGDHSELTYRNLIKGFPMINENGFLEYLNQVIRDNKIDCIYPAHDSVSVFLSEHANEIDAQVIITDTFTTNICRSKSETYKYLSEEEFVPKVYSDIDNVESFPVFVKPTIGQGSVGAFKINTKQELISIIREKDNLVICEYLSGEEYTVDCFTDKNGRLRVVSARNRERIKTGIAVRTRKIGPDPTINNIAETLNNKFHFKGAWFFQLKKNEKGEYRLLEISPRIPGTMGLSRNLGINFPMLTLFTYWDYDVDIINNGYDIMLDRAFYSAYKMNYDYDVIYVDFDDTLIINNSVNDVLIRYLYQAINKGKQIVLLSKHTQDIFEDLKKYRISETLFDKIVIVAPEDEKYKYITSSSAIFIDDSFAERKKIKDMCDIAVFDVDMVESLIDWRA